MSEGWKPHRGQAIERLYAWIATEPDGGEGIVGAHIAGMFTPLIGADRARIDSYEKTARAVMRLTGYPVRMVEFSIRTVIKDDPA